MKEGGNWNLLMLQLFKNESTHYTVANDQTQQSDVAQQKTQHFSYEFAARPAFCWRWVGKF